MTTAARAGQFTGATDNAASGGLFTDSKIDGIPDLVAADVASAQTSATTATTQAATATTQATTATTKASEAATSATAAASSATSAASSATTASTGATTATTKATAASTSATNAATSETNAATSATNSAASASSASTQATNATTQANSALSSASAANTSATNAATSASTASTQATNAATSATAAAASYDSFDDRYLGAKSSNPTVDNDGATLLDGALYFNTSDNIMLVYDLGNTTWVRTTPTTTNQGHINTVSGIQANVTTVAGISSNVTSVAGNSSNINSAVSNASNINTVAGSISNVNTVAAADTNISNLNASGVIANVGTVAGIASNVTTVAGVASNVTSVASNATNINAVNSNASNINTVAGAAANINTVASNVTGVNSFADRYRISSSAPSSSLDVGDLYFDTTANELKVYKSSGWAAAGSTVNGTSARFTYNISGTPTAVTGSDVNGATLAYDAGFVDVYLNGVKQVNGTDVTVTSGDTVTFASALANGDVVDIVGFGTFNVAAISASNINSGTVPDARFPATLPAISGANLTNLDASDLASGTVPVARLGSSGTKDSTTFLRGDNTFAVVDTTNASNLSTGTLPNARLSSVPNSALANSGITINGSAIALGGSVTVETDFTWETKTSAFSAEVSKGYFVDTSSSAITATLPASPSAGDTIRFIDLSAAFDTNNLTVARNGKKLQGDTSDMTVATERAGFALVFSGDTQGWLLMEK